MNSRIIFISLFCISQFVVFGQKITTSEIEVVQGVNTNVEGVLSTDVLSIEETRHGKIFIESLQQKQTHEFNLQELFPNLDLPNFGFLGVKIFVIMERHGVDQAGVIQELLFRKGSGVGAGGWFKSQMTNASAHGGLMGWSYGSGYSIFVTSGGSHYSVSGYIEIITKD